MSEKFRTLFENESVLIEQIDSLGYGSEPYLQNHDEWVTLLSGSATIILSNEQINLNKGDSLFIEKNTPHQVTSTSIDCQWLAVHLKK